MPNRFAPLALLCLAACLEPDPAPVAGADQRPIEAISLLGDTLYRAEPSAEALPRLEAQLDTAQRNRLADSTNPDAFLWLGRRFGYLGRYRQAITVFTDGMKRFPDDPRFLRHRGHRWITVRQLDSAVADLSRAGAMLASVPDAVEPDGAPNARGIPTSSLHANVWYHLGLAHYLRGEWKEALAAYAHDAPAAHNPDMQVATTWWRWLTLRRLGDTVAAKRLLETIPDSMDIIENQSYYRLLLYAKNRMLRANQLLDSTASTTAGDAAFTYGFGALYLVRGNAESAERTFRELVRTGNWAAFGTIAAEAELARRR